MTVRIDLGPMPPAQVLSWHGLLDVAERLPTGWCLVGGQMVYTYAIERGVQVPRTTTDIDAVLDVRARPTIWPEMTRALLDLGFSPALDLSGKEVTWLRGDARIDLLVPRHLGARWRRRSPTGGSPLETPGAQSALDSAEPVDILHEGRRGTIRRPELGGAILAKAAAFTVTLDRAPERHLVDLLVLGSCMRSEDRVGTAWTAQQRGRVGNAVARLAARPDLVAQVQGGSRAVELLRRASAPG